MEDGLKYEFKLQDLGKYSMRLKFKDMAHKFQRSALGKKVPDEEARRAKLA